MTTQHLFEKPITTPIHTYVHPEDEHRVDLIGMIHIAEQGYYDEIQTRTDTEHASGTVVHYERVTRCTPEEAANLDEAARKKISRLNHLLTGLYAMIDSLDLGLVHQTKALTYRESWQNHDATELELVDQMSGFTVWRQSIVSGTLFEILKQFDTDEQRRQIIPEFYKALSGKNNPTRRQKFIGRIIMGDATSALLDFRNDIALKAIDEQQEKTPGTDVLLLWGAGHLPGLGEGLQQRGYAKVEEENLVAMGRDL